MKSNNFRCNGNYYQPTTSNDGNGNNTNFPPTESQPNFRHRSRYQAQNNELLDEMDDRQLVNWNNSTADGYHQPMTFDNGGRNDANFSQMQPQKNFNQKSHYMARGNELPYEIDGWQVDNLNDNYQFQAVTNHNVSNGYQHYDAPIYTHYRQNHQRGYYNTGYVDYRSHQNSNLFSKNYQQNGNNTLDKNRYNNERKSNMRTASFNNQPTSSSNLFHFDNAQSSSEAADKTNNTHQYQSNNSFDFRRMRKNLDGSGRGKGFSNRYDNNRKYDNYKNSSQYENEKSDTGKENESQPEKTNRYETLISEMNLGTHTCLVCYEKILSHQATWSCKTCYSVLHLKCIGKWATTSIKNYSKWRCPSCQTEGNLVPNKYMCFCGKIELQNNYFNRLHTAHSCGEICSRSRDVKSHCQHRCQIYCHPGPCPNCEMTVNRKCNCGRTQLMVKCSSSVEPNCSHICNRLLNCNVHTCTKKCHYGDCDNCEIEIEVECYCSGHKKRVICGSGKSQKYSCGKKCQRPLTCGNHKCDDICHPDECLSCKRDPAVMTRCMCGKYEARELNVNRTNCLDPVAVCENICNKELKCGPPNKRHRCLQLCHDGECNFCPGNMKISCKCNSHSKRIPCMELDTELKTYVCEKQCNKKLSCKKHKCNNRCCAQAPEDHPCLKPCGQMLKCGKHKCELLCHLGKCPRCLNSMFTELFCECGNAYIPPPVECGTKPPKCDKPCSRIHNCKHPPMHTCHSESACPPCFVLTRKWCYGKHEQRHTIPCHEQGFSCGKPCNRPLLCGHHKCIRNCHQENDCAINECTQPCPVPRELCGHACGAPCHTGVCPTSRCKEKVEVNCECGNVKAEYKCTDLEDDWRRIRKKHGDSVKPSMVNFKILECTDECRSIEHKLKLARAFQIDNTEPSAFANFTTIYSDFMKSYAEKDPNFCRRIHNTLAELVKETKESSHKRKSYSFEVMNREKRQLVHEYCAHFGCESQSQDPPPNRNVIAFATKGEIWIPVSSVVEVVEGRRKMPGPVKPLIDRSNKQSALQYSLLSPSSNNAIGFDSDIYPNQKHVMIDYVRE